MEDTTTTTAIAQKPSLLKTALAFTISLLFLFILIYVISRAWKKGQQVAS